MKMNLGYGKRFKFTVNKRKICFKEKLKLIGNKSSRDWTPVEIYWDLLRRLIIFYCDHLKIKQHMMVQRWDIHYSVAYPNSFMFKIYTVLSPLWAPPAIRRRNKILRRSFSSNHSGVSTLISHFSILPVIRRHSNLFLDFTLVNFTRFNCLCSVSRHLLLWARTMARNPSGICRITRKFSEVWFLKYTVTWTGSRLRALSIKLLTFPEIQCELYAAWWNIDDRET